MLYHQSEHACLQDCGPDELQRHLEARFTTPELMELLTRAYKRLAQAKRTLQSNTSRWRKNLRSQGLSGPNIEYHVKHLRAQHKARFFIPDAYDDPGAIPSGADSSAIGRTAFGDRAPSRCPSVSSNFSTLTGDDSDELSQDATVGKADFAIDIRNFDQRISKHPSSDSLAQLELLSDNDPSTISTKQPEEASCNNEDPDFDLLLCNLAQDNNI